jgi:deoxyadenosine/deoxycytidine kinase
VILISIVGIPAAGKTTLAKALRAADGLAVVEGRHVGEVQADFCIHLVVGLETWRQRMAGRRRIGHRQAPDYLVPTARRWTMLSGKANELGADLRISTDELKPAEVHALASAKIAEWTAHPVRI